MVEGSSHFHACVSLTDCIIANKSRGFTIPLRIPNGPSDSQLRQENDFNLSAPQPERAVPPCERGTVCKFRPVNLKRRSSPVAPEQIRSSLFFPGTEGSLPLTDDPGSLWSFQGAVKAAAARDDVQHPHGEVKHDGCLKEPSLVLLSQSVWICP